MSESFKDEADQAVLLERRKTDDMLRNFFALTVSETDKLRGAMVEALFWLDENAPSRASETLKKALNIQ